MGLESGKLTVWKSNRKQIHTPDVDPWEKKTITTVSNTLQTREPGKYNPSSTTQAKQPSDFLQVSQIGTLMKIENSCASSTKPQQLPLPSKGQIQQEHKPIPNSLFFDKFSTFFFLSPKFI